MTFRHRILDSAFSDHFMSRCKERGISIKHINDSVLAGRIRIKFGGIMEFTKNGICVIINNESKVYITAYAIDSKGGVLR